MISNKVVAVPVFGIPVPAWTYEIEETETIFYTKEKGERTHSQCFKYMIRKRKKESGLWYHTGNEAISVESRSLKRKLFQELNPFFQTSILLL